MIFDCWHRRLRSRPRGRISCLVCVHNWQPLSDRRLFYRQTPSNQSPEFIEPLVRFVAVPSGVDDIQFGTDGSRHNGALHLLEPAAPRGQRLPIDFFFRSLAQDQHERAICIVLSGTGSDGTGVRAIKGEGGMAMAQNPESTEYDGMPSSAIATGLVDYVLPPAEMPAQLIAYVAHAFGKARLPPPAAPANPKTR